MKGKIKAKKRQIYIDPIISSIPFNISTKMNLTLSDGQSGRGDFHGLTKYLNAGVLDTREFLRRGLKYLKI